MLKIVIVVLVFISQCCSQYDQAYFANYQNFECRPVEEFLRFGGCYRNQFLCHDKDRVTESLLSPSEMSDNVFAYTGCSCDPSCWKFNDCCIDATPVEPVLEKELRWKCDLLPGSRMHIFVIASCPPEWNNPTDVSLCERRVSDDDYSYLLDIPVFSNSTGRAYSNIYCAKCHQDSYLSSFHVVLTCSSDLVSCRDRLHHAYYMYGEHRWLIYARGKYFGHYVRLTVLEYQDWEDVKKSYAVRRCQPVRESCSNDTQFEYAKHCMAYYSSYVENAGIVYKNIYCALCNNVGLEWSIKCFNGTESSNLPQLYPSDNYSLTSCMSWIPYTGLAGFRESSYPWLFDFHDPLGTNEVGLESRCKEGEILDPIRDLCLPFVCGKPFIKVGGNCVNNGVNRTQNKVIRRQNCYILSINKEEITILPENNSIYINKTGLTYESSDFEEYDNDTYLVCHPSDLFVEKFSTTQSLLSQATMAVSLTCLAVHISIHAYIPKLRNLPGKNLLSLSISLFIAQVLFLFGSSTAAVYPILCTAIAIVTHFCFLASFFWMNVMAFDIYRTFAVSRSSASHQKIFWRYAAYAWCTPFAIVLMALTADFTDVLATIRPGYGRRICWLSHRQGLLVFFALPLAFLLFANVVFFLLTAYEIHHTTKLTRSVIQRKKDQIRFFLYVKLALIMGLTWVIRYVAAIVAFDPLWYVFIILNAGQGTFIFIAFSLKRKVINLLIHRFKGKSAEALAGSSSTSKSTNYITASTKSSCDQVRSPPSLENEDH